MKAKHVQVLIRRDMAEIISTAVFEHEVGILSDIHGPGKIEQIDGDYPEVEIDASEEYARLASFYGTNESGQLYVERVIGIGHRKLEEFYGAEVEEAPRRGRKAKADE